MRGSLCGKLSAGWSKLVLKGKRQPTRFDIDGNASSLAVKTVGEKDHYTRIGVAFPLEKGGFNILFDALPTNGRVLLLPERARSVNDEG